MPLEWGVLVFVQRWRHSAARGLLIGLRRPFDRTTAEVRVQGAELGAGAPHAHVDVEVTDVGDLAREKRMALLDRVAVVIEARVTGVTVGTTPTRSHPLGARRPEGGDRRLLRRGVQVAGIAGEGDGERSVAVDIGIPLIVTFPSPEAAAAIAAGTPVQFTVAEDLRGYFVTG